MITIEQCRAARGLLGWTQQELAQASGLSKTAINNFEKGHSSIKNESLRAIRSAFEKAGIEFDGDQGLHKKTENVLILKGDTAYSTLLDDIHQTVGDQGEILISHSENLLTEVSKEKIDEHVSYLKEHGISERILCAEGTESHLPPNAYCRWIPGNSKDTAMSTIIYGDKIALDLWDHAMIVVICSETASQAERNRFENLWSKADARPSDNDNATNRKAGGT